MTPPKTPHVIALRLCVLFAAAFAGSLHDRSERMPSCPYPRPLDPAKYGFLFVGIV